MNRGRTHRCFNYTTWPEERFGMSPSDETRRHSADFLPDIECAGFMDQGTMAITV